MAVEKWLVFSVWIEINTAFVSGHRNRLDIRMGIEIDLISVMGSKLTWFLCGWPKMTWFQCGGSELTLISVMGSKLTWFLCGGRKWLVLSVGIEIYSVCVFVGGIELHWIFSVSLNWLDFTVGSRTWYDQCRDRNWRFCAGVEDYLVLVSGSKLGCFFVSKHQNWLELNWGSKWTWFQWWVEIILSFVWGIEVH